MVRERNSDHKCRSDSGASFCSRSDERLSLDSEERKAVPLHKREIWFINMMNGNQVKFLWGRRTGIIPRSTPRFRISDEYKSSLSPFLFDLSSTVVLARLLSCKGKDETRSSLLGLASWNVQDLLQVFLAAAIRRSRCITSRRSYQARSRDFRTFAFVCTKNRAEHF